MTTPRQTRSGELNLKQRLTVLVAYRKGTFSACISNDLVIPLNEMIRVVGTDDKLGGHVKAKVKGVSGRLKDLTNQGAFHAVF